MTNLEPQDPSTRELLEKIDAIILGSVTLLDEVAKVDTQGGPSAGEGPGGAESGTKTGRRIEVDAKLLSRSDGRIIAAAQRDGPVGCLRAIVERLGVALEQEYLRPYFGQLKVNLSEPRQVTVLLTPILLDTALDEEKPPVERSATIISEPKKDIVEPWTTDPTTYTIKNLLSGWYSMRLERSGYEVTHQESNIWEARDYGRVQVYHHDTGMQLERTPKNLRRFVVHVEQQYSKTLDIDELGFEFRKLGGTLDPRVKRQYLDKGYDHRPGRTVLIASKLEINDLKKLAEYGDDEDCDLFKEEMPEVSDLGDWTVVKSGHELDFDSFTGGDLFIENYQDEMLPVGDYEMIVWEPAYHPRTSMVTVRDKDSAKQVRAALLRETSSLALGTTGTRPANKVTLEGVTTHHPVVLPLDFDHWKTQESLPVDTYRASTDINGLTGWLREVALPAESLDPPFLDTRDEFKGPILRNALRLAETMEAKEEDKAEQKEQKIPRLKIKTRLAVGGRLSALSIPPDPASADVFVDRDLGVILDLLLYGRQKDEEGDRSVWLNVLAGLGKEVLRQVTIELVAPGAGALASPPAATPAQSPQPLAPAPASEPAAGQGASTENPPAPAPESFPVDEEALRALLAVHLQDLDLLVLDDEDLARARETPAVSAILAKYVDSGGALFAFATKDGDYGRVLGSPLFLRADGKPTDSFEFAPGEVAGITLRAGGKKAKVKNKRVLPELERLDSVSSWRVVAVGKGRRDVRILERGFRDQGGYVAIWLDDPASFRGRLGGTVPQVEEIRNRVERYVLDWARFLMERRYGKAGERRADASAVR